MRIAKKNVRHIFRNSKIEIQHEGAEIQGDRAVRKVQVLHNLLRKL